MSTVDVLIAVPLIPLFPVLATWWLPWERWLWSKVPKWILGPCLLYASFAAWHFDMPWWVCLVAGFDRSDSDNRVGSSGQYQTRKRRVITAQVVAART